MEDFINSIDQWSLVKLLGGLSIILSSLFSFIAISIKDIFLKKQSHKQDIKIEILKNKLTHNEGIINKLQDTHSKIFLESSPKKISALEAIWKSFIDIRNNIPSIIILANSILTKNEYMDFENSMNHIYGNITNSFKEDEVIKKHSDIFNLAELQRPFISEKLWSIFYVYQILHGRLVYLFFKGKKNKKYTHWTDDNGSLSVLKQIIPDKDLASLIKDSVLAYTNTKYYLEFKVCNEISEIISGEKASQDILEKSIKMAENINNELSFFKVK